MLGIVSICLRSGFLLSINNQDFLGFLDLKVLYKACFVLLVFAVKNMVLMRLQLDYP